MKNIVLIVVFLISSLGFAQQNKYQKFYSDFEDQDGITTISINKAMFSLLGSIKMDNELDDLTPLLKKMNSIKMIIHDGKQNLQLKSKLKSEFNNLNLEELMSVNNAGNKVKFFAENSLANVFKQLVLNITNTDSMIFMILDGEIKADDLNSLLKK